LPEVEPAAAATSPTSAIGADERPWRLIAIVAALIAVAFVVGLLVGLAIS
jgi:hypothetical protein